MRRNNRGELRPFFNAKSLLSLVPQLQRLADVTVLQMINVDSSDIDPSLWTKLFTTIKDKEKLFDAFVVTHGTDTMAYTASAASFALRSITKPIVFTGAQKPVEDLPSDASNNLINAIIAVTTLPVGISIVFGPKILQANRATKISESELDAFDSPMVSPLGVISLKPRIINSTHKPLSHLNWNHMTFDPNILEIQLIHGLSCGYLTSLLSKKCHGIILEGFGPGNIPKSLLQFFKQAKGKQIPVVILSQCRSGITQMKLYEAGSRALKEGAIPGGDMTVEAAATKLMWIMAKTRDLKVIKDVFQKNISGEVTNYDK